MWLFFMRSDMIQMIQKWDLTVWSKSCLWRLFIDWLSYGSTFSQAGWLWLLCWQLNSLVDSFISLIIYTWQFGSFNLPLCTCLNYSLTVFLRVFRIQKLFLICLLFLLKIVMKITFLLKVLHFVYFEYSYLQTSVSCTVCLVC